MQQTDPRSEKSGGFKGWSEVSKPLNILSLRSRYDQSSEVQSPIHQLPSTILPVIEENRRSGNHVVKKSKTGRSNMDYLSKKRS